MIRISQAFLLGTLSVCLTAMLAFIGGWRFAYETQKVPINLNLTEQGEASAEMTSARQNRSDFRVFWEVWDLVNQEFYHTEPLDKQQMIYGSIRGMLHSLEDDYTVFEEPRAAERTRESMRGSFDGIGILIQIREGELVVARPLRKSPAMKAGLQADDIIVGIDDTTVAALTEGLDEAEALDAVATRIRGPRNSTVRLTIRRPPNPDTFEVTVTRDKVPLISVNSEMLDDGVAYLQITEFNNATPTELDEALREGLLPNQPEGLILDLRNNHGGVLLAAQQVLGRFYNGAALYEKNSGGELIELPTVNDSNLLVDPEIPLVILVNEHSASAAEVVAGALGERRPNTTLMGTRTFGKGSVQNVHELLDGSSVRITTARWLTPDQQAIHKVGIAPDHLVLPAEELDPANTVACVGIRLPPEGHDQCYDAQLRWGIRFLVANEIPPTPAPTPAPTPEA